LTCKKSSNGEFLCIAEQVFFATEEKLNRLWVDMQLLAEKMGVTYDGWETRIDLD
jgi:regulator of RNase E activity RraB